MKRTNFLLLMALFLLPSVALAQVSKKDSTQIKKYLDSLSVILNKYEADTAVYQQNPYLYQMTTGTYYNAPARAALGLDSIKDVRQEAMYNALLNAYLYNPVAFSGTEDNVSAVKDAAAVAATTAPEIKVEDLVEVAAPELLPQTAWQLDYSGRSRH